MQHVTERGATGRAFTFLSSHRGLFRHKILWRLDIAAFAVIAAVSLAAPVAAETLTFQSLQTAGTSFTRIVSYSESGYLFSSSNPDTGFAFWHTGNTQYSGSTTLWNWAGGGTTTLSRVGAGPFNISSIDLVELVRTPIAPTSVTFLGTRTDASTVTQTFSLDGVFGPQLFTFNAGFTGLSTLSWVQGNGGAGTGHAFDNLVVTAATTTAPEPGSLALLLPLLGTVGIAARRRRQ